MRKRFSLSLIGLSLCIAINAQGFHYGATAHIAINHPKNYRTHLGWGIGVAGEYHFQGNKYGNFYLAGKIKLTEKGWKDYIYDLDLNKYNQKVDAYYLEFPLSVGYKYKINAQNSLFLDLGPYLAYGLFGNNHIDYAEYEDNDNAIFKDDIYKRFDFGFQASIGINISKFQIGLSTSQSIIKPTKKKWETENPKDKSIMLYLSYFLH